MGLFPGALLTPRTALPQAGMNRPFGVSDMSPSICPERCSRLETQNSLKEFRGTVAAMPRWADLESAFQAYIEENVRL